MRDKAVKLHDKFCHPTAERLIDLIQRAGTQDLGMENIIREVTLQCDICMKYKNTGMFCQGDSMYFRKNNQSKCRGPVMIADKDPQPIIRKYGDDTRENSCRMQVYQRASAPSVEGETASHDDKDQEANESFANDDIEYMTADEDCQHIIHSEHPPFSSKPVHVPSGLVLQAQTYLW